MSGWKEYRENRDRTEPERLALLVVDDEERILETLLELFQDRYDVVTCGGPDEALRLFRERRPHLVLCDQRMPGRSGIELLKEIREIEPGAVRMLITGYSDISVVIGALNEKVLHRYITKPWVNEELLTIVAEEAQRYLEENGLAGTGGEILF